MNYFLIYFWTRLDAISGVLGFLQFIVFIGTVGYIIACAVFYFNAREKKEESKLPFRKRYLLPMFFIGFATLATPSKQDALYIFFVPQIANSEAAEDAMAIIQKLPKALRLELEGYLEEKLKERK